MTHRHYSGSEGNLRNLSNLRIISVPLFPLRPLCNQLRNAVVLRFANSKFPWSAASLARPRSSGARVDAPLHQSPLTFHLSPSHPLPFASFASSARGFRPSDCDCTFTRLALGFLHANRSSRTDQKMDALRMPPGFRKRSLEGSVGDTPNHRYCAASQPDPFPDSRLRNRFAVHYR